jgi:2-(1,2-epoxy-1,2-dihydrophenyl)acetyl-CoA isomerase
VPDSGASFFLTHMIGEARARALAMLGDSIDAERAAKWGMIWQALDDAELLPKAEALTAQLSQAPTEALARMKRMFAAAVTNSLDAQLDLEAKLQGESGRTADYAEGVRAFVEKRAPKFKGGA